jgi:hypothetical protein
VECRNSIKSRRFATTLILLPRTVFVNLQMFAILDRLLGCEFSALTPSNGPEGEWIDANGDANPTHRDASELGAAALDCSSSGMVRVAERPTDLGWFLESIGSGSF